MSEYKYLIVRDDLPDSVRKEIIDLIEKLRIQIREDLGTFLIGERKCGFVMTVGMDKQKKVIVPGAAEVQRNINRDRPCIIQIRDLVPVRSAPSTEFCAIHGHTAALGTIRCFKCERERGNRNEVAIVATN